MDQMNFAVGDRVVLASRDPFVRQSLVGEEGVIAAVYKARAVILFDGDRKPRTVHLVCLQPANGAGADADRARGARLPTDAGGAGALLPGFRRNVDRRDRQD